MSDRELYNLLNGEEQRDIPWDRAARGFLMLKLASGAVLPRHIDEFKKEAGLHSAVTQDQAEHALGSGILSGIRRSSSGDIAYASAVRRKRGERIGKTTGSVAGTAAGYLAAKKLGLPQSHGAALGALLGYGSGKAVGEEVDRARAKSRMKRASIEKTAKSEEDKARFRRALKIVGGTAAAGAAIGGGIRGIKHVRGVRTLHQIAKELGTSEAAPLIKALAVAGESKSRLARNIVSGATQGAVAGIPFGGIAHNINEGRLKRKKEKTAAAPLDPPINVPVEAPGTNPMEDFLSAQQQANEAEFFKQQAEEAQTNAQLQEERAAMLEQQLQTTQQTAQMQQQDSAMKDQASQQQTMMAQQGQQQAQQEAVMARDESLQAQQANIALRQAVTSYRQQLMDLLSQDPTQMVPPPTAPQAAPPEMQQVAPQAMPAQQGAALPPGGPPAAPAEQPQAAPAPAAPEVQQPAAPDLQMMPAPQQGAQ